MKRFRDTITGRYVSRAAAKLRPPAETVGETVTAPLVVTDAMVRAGRDQAFIAYGESLTDSQMRAILETSLKEAR